MYAIVQSQPFLYFGCQLAFAGAKKCCAIFSKSDLLRDVHLANDLRPDLIALLPRLRRFALTMTRAHADADDLVQEACLRALNRSEQWDKSRPLDRWVFRIMRNLWISEIRKRQVRLGQGHVQAEDAPELVFSETAEQTLVASQLMGQIAALPEELASVLLAVSVEGFSYAEAAELLDIPIGTVMSRIHRARKVLAGQLSKASGGQT